MSIKKCIMNYFDKATNAMIPFHPQTESGAITDWHESVIKSLASKVLPTVVNELTTDSVMGKLMKMLLNASGVKYSIDTNGYICLGSFFGGLIIQWVTVSGSTISGDGYAIASLPMTYSTAQFGCWMCTLDAFSSTSIYGCAKDGLNAVKYAYRRDGATVSYIAVILSFGA